MPLSNRGQRNGAALVTAGDAPPQEPSDKVLDGSNEQPRATLPCSDKPTITWTWLVNKPLLAAADFQRSDKLSNKATRATDRWRTFIFVSFCLQNWVERETWNVGFWGWGGWGVSLLHSQEEKRWLKNFKEEGENSASLLLQFHLSSPETCSGF